MGSRFTALPIGSGEAFLLQTKHAGRKWAILVDSGNLDAGTPHPLVAAINKTAPHLQRIDIAICTHHDMDHARGFQSFADAWCTAQREIGEFWLPGRWSAAIPSILFDPLDVVQRIWNGTFEVSRRLFHGESADSGRTTLEERLREVARDIELYREFSEFVAPGELDELVSTVTAESEQPRRERLARSLGVGDDKLRALDISIEESDRKPSAILRRIESRAFWWFDPFWWGRVDAGHRISAMSLFLEAVETLKTIATIAESAVRWRIPIRWFDFGQFEQSGTSSGGIKDFLEPVSAVELRRPPPRVSDVALFLCLRLSKQNVESLVFHRLETEAEPSVTFLGDSRLSFGIGRPQGRFSMPQPAPKRSVLVTAPHHGSRVNDVAYDIIRNWLGNSGISPIYVRNGGHHKQTIGAFLDEPRRCCAQCRLCAPRKLARSVTLTSGNGNWIWPKRGVPKCKV